jgi:cellulose synthase/poly-beta-1,6-N-acetylglucosamine synthase-like glycosyltransferase
LTALILYILLGPGLWALFGVSMVMGIRRMNRLRRPARPLPPVPPRVDILIPAKDEGEAVRGCLDSVLAMDYPHFTVVTIDDRSTDTTGAIFDEYAAKFPQKFCAIHIAHGALPAGWLGKSHALWTAAQQCDADWILFIDSDVKVQTDALSAVLALAIDRDYDAVSIMTRLECHSFFERLILPLCAASVGAMTLMSFTNRDNAKAMAFANGQFFLMKRSAYLAVEGHSRVRDDIVEDVALMRNLKANDFTTRLYFGKQFASTRMGTSLRQMFNGWSRILSGVSRRRPARIFAAMFFVLSGLSAYVAGVAGACAFASHGDIRWLTTALAHLLLQTIILLVIYRMSGNSRAYALLFPIGGPMLLAIYSAAVRACYSGKIAWRGTVYSPAQNPTP